MVQLLLSCPLNAATPEITQQIDGPVSTGGIFPTNIPIGSSVACLTDFFKDGGSDVLIGSAGSLSDLSIVSIYNPQTKTNTNIPDPLLPSSSSLYGTSVRAAGDLNADGNEDFLVGDPSGPAAYAFFGPFIGGASAVASVSLFDSLSIGGTYASELSTYPSKLSGSPHQHVILANPGHEISAGNPTGRIALMQFDSLLSSSSLRIELNGTVTNSKFGARVQILDDYFSDGLVEVAVAAPGDSSLPGTVQILSIDPTGNSGQGTFHTDQTILAPQSANDDSFGLSIANIGDINGDNFDDLLVGSPGTNQDTGAAHVYTCAPNNNTNQVNCTIVCTIGGPGINDRFGTAVAGVGDINQDGQNDFLIGIPGVATGVGRLEAYTYSTSGGSSNCTKLETLDGNAVDHHKSLGGSISATEFLSSTCDFNSDGLPDFIIRTDENTSGQSNSGRVELVETRLDPSPSPSPSPSASAAPAPIVPSSSKLSFKITKDGTFKTTHEFDVAPNESSQCTSKLFARVSIGKTKLRLHLIKTATEALQLTEEMTIKNMPIVAKVNGVRPILNLAMLTDCINDTKLVSNVVSRYMNCGTEEVVSIAKWINILKKEFNLLDSDTFKRKANKRKRKRKLRRLKRKLKKL